jgi:hypothetical protein
MQELQIGVTSQSFSNFNGTVNLADPVERKFLPSVQVTL